MKLESAVRTGMFFQYGGERHARIFIWRNDGVNILINHLIIALIACFALAACSSALPDVGGLQSALLNGGGKQQIVTGSITSAERSPASRVLTAIAIEHVTGEAGETVSLYK